MGEIYTRSRTRWAFGRRRGFDVTNRKGDAMRPGREDYSVILAYDAKEAEPVLDWSAAYDGWEPVGRHGREGRVLQPSPVGELRESTAVLDWKEQQ
jgi:hypothetical protein